MSDDELAAVVASATSGPTLTAPRVAARLEDAITVLDETTCDLTGQFSGSTGAGPYTLAPGVFQWGPNTVRQAANLPATWSSNGI